MRRQSFAIEPTRSSVQRGGRELALAEDPKFIYLYCVYNCTVHSTGFFQFGQPSTRL
jgi:hypothetical protein